MGVITLTSVHLRYTLKEKQEKSNNIFKKMALQQLFVKYKNGIVASALTAVAIPIINSFSNPTLRASQIIFTGIQLGTQTYVAGIPGPSMFANLDADTFADVQAVLFPRYILFNTATSLLALLGYMKHSPSALLTELWSPGANLCLSFATNIVNLFVFFPWTHKVLVTYMSAKKDKDADEKTISKARMNFGIVHGICNLINYVTMGANLLFIYKMTAV